jgi:hypothetical protein
LDKAVASSCIRRVVRECDAHFVILVKAVYDLIFAGPSPPDRILGLSLMAYAVCEPRAESYRSAHQAYLHRMRCGVKTSHANPHRNRFFGPTLLGVSEVRLEIDCRCSWVEGRVLGELCGDDVLYANVLLRRTIVNP